MSHQNIINAKQTVLIKEVVEESIDEKIVVEIKGAVNIPGVYNLEKDMRLKDLVELAGGLTEHANSDYINMARKVIDEEVIVIYAKKEPSQKVEVNDLQLEKLKLTKSHSTTHEQFDFVIDINQATKEDFMKLPGIGEVKAMAIIAYRDEIAMFKSIDQLIDVKGIGEKTLEKIKPYITH
jgi:competence protein ComEA